MYIYYVDSNSEYYYIEMIKMLIKFFHNFSLKFNFIVIICNLDFSMQTKSYCHIKFSVTTC